MSPSIEQPPTSHFNANYALAQYHPEYKEQSYYHQSALLTPPTSPDSFSSSPSNKGVSSPRQASSPNTSPKKSPRLHLSQPKQPLQPPLTVLPISPPPSPLNPHRLRLSLPQPEQTLEMTRNGIINLYVTHATSHITSHERARRPYQISRSRVEHELLTEIDRGGFPTEYKIAWYHAILSSSYFEAFWLATSKRLRLPDMCTARFVPDTALLEYDAPVPAPSLYDSPPEMVLDRSSPLSSLGPQDVNNEITNGDAEDDEIYISPEAAALARRLGSVDETPDGAFDQVRLLDPLGLKRQNSGQKGGRGGESVRGGGRVRKARGPKGAPAMRRGYAAARATKKGKVKLSAEGSAEGGNGA
ncbi:hypothetical protein ACLMJK_000074 [Lecanora helva]